MSDTTAAPASALAAPPVSHATAWKIVATVVVISGAVGALLYRSTRAEMQYYRHVDEVMVQMGDLRGKRLQVHGNVVDIEKGTGSSMDYRFRIESRAPRPHAVITATYTGLVPDTFKPGSEVVASGMLAADNHLQVSPDGVMAKCPSKYEAGKQAVGDNKY